ncbi:MULTISPECIES: DUF2147 domain-containing protein [Simplicispira]|uniref:Uncharacterized protein (DUF2147 family) n=1 Tax=Simplicispira metamorpha TaxID=80881 RepID=A0A4R2N5Y3_9BURK|nr:MULTISPECIES: DUF2147 domain-containing protein [Simplicispira]MBP7413213.1 DUF2147 domain-containing protein [Giesbergeria sp.]MBP8204448.1 DUF2147 domain-containing protein [Giesbergeria sp.]MDD2691535.1 DUF2147 domain-containing protein [Simplicispira sp.]TCP16263.1 uncharacterized protein (DUF2147 family) [Simplicispira metamorpha]
MRQALAAIIFVAISAPAWAQMTPEGLWRNIDDKSGEAKAEIRIQGNSAGVLTGVLEKRLAKDAKPDDLCKECSDERKNQPILGLEIIRGAQKAEGKDVWEGGKILDPENGRNYTLRLTPIEGGKKLEVRGSLGPFGRTQTWVRVQ